MATGRRTGKSTSSSRRRRPKGEGSVFPVKSGRWRAQVDLGAVNGKRKYTTRERGSEQEAKDELRKLLRQVDDGITPDGTTTVDAWLDYWLTNVKTDLSDKTRTEYQGNIRRHISPAIGRLRLRDLQPEHLEAIYAGMREKGLGVSSIRQAHAPVSAALETAVRRRRIPYNPAKLVEGRYGDAHKPVSYRQWTSQQAFTVLKTVRDDPSDQVRMMCALLLALRQGEVLALRWEDVHEDEVLQLPGSPPGEGHLGYLHVEHSITRKEVAGRKTKVRALGPTKAKTVHDIPLPAPVREAFARLRAVRTSDTWVFPGARADAPRENKIDWERFREISKRAGVPLIPPHGARGTAGSVLSDLGVSPVVIALILRHSDVAVTVKHYARADTSMQVKALDMLSKKWKEALKPSAPGDVTSTPELTTIIEALQAQGQNLTEEQIAGLTSLLSKQKDEHQP